MYAYLNGKLADIEPDNLVIDVNGVGYNVHVYNSDTLYLPVIGSDIKFYTYTCVAEDKFILYGFTTKEELDLFKLLISVNGVGPKSAQAMLSVLGVSDIRIAIATEDIKTISKTPGLGAKTAGRLINDLKDKMVTDVSALTKSSSKTEPAAALSKKLSPAEEECVDALVSLGYQRSNAVKAVSMLEGSEGMSADEMIGPALKNIMRL